MKLTTRLLLLLAILTLSTGCSAQTAPVAPSFDTLVHFDPAGQAVVRGQISGDYSCSTVNGRLRANLWIDVPVLVDGIESSVSFPFTLQFETELASDRTPYTSLRDYLAANPGSTTFDAFAILETVEVTFIQKDAAFEALAIRQVHGDDTPAATMNGIISTGLFSRGSLDGTIAGSNWGEDLVTWTLSVPVTVQGVPVAILLPIRSTEDTNVITTLGDTPMDMYHPGGSVRVDFKRTGDTLEALRFTEIR